VQYTVCEASYFNAAPRHRVGQDFFVGNPTHQLTEAVYLAGETSLRRLRRVTKSSVFCAMSKMETWSGLCCPKRYGVRRSVYLRGKYLFVGQCMGVIVFAATMNWLKGADVDCFAGAHQGKEQFARTNSDA
jgi:hypothetical protein